MKKRTETTEALVIVAKYPEVGAVKTRLARYLGNEPACQLYLSFIRDLEEKFGRGPRPLYWAYTPPESDFPSIVSAQNQCFPQEGSWLGERLYNIFRRLFQQDFQRVVVMSSDSPHMRTEWIDQAFASLTDADAVLAPAEDGGYNLIGLNQPHDLFSGIPMSTPTVLANTLKRASDLGLSIYLLPGSFDVDELEDVNKLQRWLAQDGDDLPHTREVLKQIGKL